jgi:hypothetical protein
METIETTVNVGKYKFTPLKNSNGTPFVSSTKLPVTISNDAHSERLILNLHGYKIIDNTLSIREQIYCRNFKIGGNHPDCVNVSIKYNQNQPVSASMPHIMYDQDCSIDIPLDRGEGSILMIKTLFQYIHQQLPNITEVNFEDKSNIECANEDEIQKGSRFRKKGTYVEPIPLYYFSIAFNGKTWYEKHFNARQKDKNKHDKYKEKINNLLYSIGVKSNTSFLQFMEIAQPPIEIIPELEKYYDNSNTFALFFQSIPKNDRCRLVRRWISTFMEFYLQDVFSNAGWIIELPIIMNSKNGGKRSTRKYYCPKGRIKHSKTYKDFGVDVANV